MFIGLSLRLDGSGGADDWAARLIDNGDGTYSLETNDSKPSDTVVPTLTATVDGTDYTYSGHTIADLDAGPTFPDGYPTIAHDGAGADPVADDVVTVDDGYVIYQGTLTGPTVQFQRDGVDIGGATSETYTVVSADEGAAITAEYDASDDNGSVTEETSALNVPSSGFSPGDITGHQRGYDASDAGTITDTAGAVTQLDDTSGNSLHMSATSGEEPTTGVDTINSLNVLTFDGTEKMTDLASATTVSGTLFIIFQPDTVDNSNDSVYSFDGTSNGNADFQLDANNSSEFRGVADSGRHTDLSYGATNLNGAPVMLIYQWDSTTNTASIRKNGGTVIASTSDYTTDYDTTSNVYLMSNKVGGQELAGKFCQLDSYNTALSLADINTYGTTIASKWGLTWTTAT